MVRDYLKSIYLDAMFFSLGDLQDDILESEIFFTPCLKVLSAYTSAGIQTKTGHYSSAMAVWTQYP